MAATLYLSYPQGAAAQSVQFKDPYGRLLYSTSLAVGATNVPFPVPAGAQVSVLCPIGSTVCAPGYPWSNVVTVAAPATCASLEFPSPPTPSLVLTEPCPSSPSPYGTPAPLTPATTPPPGPVAPARTWWIIGAVVLGVLFVLAILAFALSHRHRAASVMK